MLYVWLHILTRTDNGCCNDSHRNPSPLLLQRSSKLEAHRLLNDIGNITSFGTPYKERTNFRGWTFTTLLAKDNTTIALLKCTIKTPLKSHLYYRFKNQIANKGYSKLSRSLLIVAAPVYIPGLISALSRSAADIFIYASLF